MMKDPALVPSTRGPSYSGIHIIKKDTMIKRGDLYWKDKFKTLEMDYGMDVAPDVMYEEGPLKFTTRRSYGDIHRKKSMKVDLRPPFLAPIKKKKFKPKTDGYDFNFPRKKEIPKKEDEPKDWKGILEKAEKLFEEGEFERSLLLFHQGRRIKPGTDAFRLGVSKCEWAIKSSFYELSKSLPPEIGNPTKRASSREPTNVKSPSKLGYRPTPRKSIVSDKPLMVNKESTKNRPSWRANFVKKEENRKKLVKYTLLIKPSRFLKGDKAFLEGVLRDIDPKIRQGAKIQKDIYGAITYIDTRHKFWTQQVPRHVRERDIAVLETLPEEPEELEALEEEDPVVVLYRYVCQELVEVNALSVLAKHGPTIERAKALVAKIMESEAVIPGAGQIIGNCFCMIGNAYLDQGETKKALAFHLQDMQMATEFDLAESKSRAIDNVGRVYARTGNYDKAIGVWMQKLPLIKDDSEMAWMCHEMGYCYLELKRYDDSAFMGEKSLDAATKAGDMHWQLNSSILVAQSTLRSGNADAALKAFERCTEIAERKGDDEAASKLKSAIEEVKEVLAFREAEDREAERLAKENEEAAVLQRRGSIHVKAGVTWQEGEAPPPGHQLNGDLPPHLQSGDLPGIMEDDEDLYTATPTSELTSGGPTEASDEEATDPNSVTLPAIGAANGEPFSTDRPIKTRQEAHQTPKPQTGGKEAASAAKKKKIKRSKSKKVIKGLKNDDLLQELLDQEEQEIARQLGSRADAVSREAGNADSEDELDADDLKILQALEVENKKIKDEKGKKEQRHKELLEQRRKRKEKKRKAAAEKKRQEQQAREREAAQQQQQTGVKSEADSAKDSVTPSVVFLPNDPPPSAGTTTATNLGDTDTLLDKQFGSRVMTASTGISGRESDRDDLGSEIHTEDEEEAPGGERQQPDDPNADIPVVHAGSPENLEKLIA